MHKSRFLLLASIIVSAATVRVAPYVLQKMGLTDITQYSAFLWNYSPIMALFLFGGAQFSERRWAFLAPLAAIFVSDVAIGLLLGDMSMGLHSGIPFFKRDLASTPLFAVALFGGCALAESWFPAFNQSSFAPAKSQQSVAT